MSEIIGVRQLSDGSTAVMYSDQKIMIASNASPNQIAEWREKGKRDAGLQTKRLRKLLGDAANRFLAERSAALILYEKAHRVEKQPQHFVRLHASHEQQKSGKQRGGSTRSSVKSGDGNEDGDPDPYDILVPDPIFLDPRVTTYGESQHKVSFRCIRKAILGCRIQDPTPRQKVAIDFYAAKFAQVCRALLRQNRFDPLTPAQRQDAESAIPAHLLKKMAANHNFEKMPNPNVKVIFNPNFRTINDVLHAAYPGSASENPTCPLEMYERIRHQGKVSFLPSIQNDDGDYIQAIDRIPAEESSYLSQEELIERAEAEQESKQELASEQASTEEGSRKKLSFAGDVLPLLCKCTETELRERLPGVVSLLPKCGIKRSTARGVLETRAKDKFGKYPDREKCQQILEIFDQVPLQRKTGGAA